MPKNRGYYHSRDDNSEQMSHSKASRIHARNLYARRFPNKSIATQHNPKNRSASYLLSMRNRAKWSRGSLFGAVLGLAVWSSCILAAEKKQPISNAYSTEIAAVSSDKFLSSLGVNTHVDQGYDPNSYVAPLRYLGVRNIRDSGRNVPGLLLLHQQAGIFVDLLGADVIDTVAAAKMLARADALLSIEGPNEPNNFPVTYNGLIGGSAGGWAAVAQLQKDLYSTIKGDQELMQYPVFHVSEGGAETDNMGLQFLKIPSDAKTLMPDGTEYADYANVHNYVSGIRIGYVDNQAWQAADPTLDGFWKGIYGHWDGLYGEYGRTWKSGFRGYSDGQLEALPRVTTETGWDAPRLEDERTQGVVLVNTYLAQFKRRWRYTFIYELGEGEGGGGNQGLFHKDWTPKLAATYIHNLTSILVDPTPVLTRPGTLDYSVASQSSTVHDLLLQKSSGPFELVVWGESVRGSNAIKIDLGTAHAVVRMFDVTLGVTPIQTLRNVSSIDLSLNDHAMVVEIE